MRQAVPESDAEGYLTAWNHQIPPNVKRRLIPGPETVRRYFFRLCPGPESVISREQRLPIYQGKKKRWRISGYIRIQGGVREALRIGMSGEPQGVKQFVNDDVDGFFFREILNFSAVNQHVRRVRFQGFVSS